jgi:hypothetical protein
MLQLFLINSIFAVLIDKRLKQYSITALLSLNTLNSQEGSLTAKTYKLPLCS